MHTNSNHPDQGAQAQGLATKATHTQNCNDSPPQRVDLMPFIDVGTF
jgi:hypothetical protein